MKVAIMQPYFLPYLGYFSLIKHTKKFILFDTVQFIRHGWIERNRILKPNEGWQYINVPLRKHIQSTLIKDIRIDNSLNWKEKMLAQLMHYKKKAPFYNETINVLKSVLELDIDEITNLDYCLLREICKYLGINFDCEIFSQMNIKIESVKAPDEWALNICKSLNGVDEYWNPIGGLEFFDRNKYEKAGIKIKFLEHNLPFYSQRRGIENFENGLSIIDVMMFNDNDAVNEMLDDYELY